MLIFSCSPKKQTLKVKLTPLDFKSSVVTLRFPTRNVEEGSYSEIIAIAWTNKGFKDVYRTLFDIDLTSIPENAIITNAKIKLYHSPTSSNPGHSQLSGSNAAEIRRITSPWDVKTVSWKTLPYTSDENIVNIPASRLDNENYEIDMKAIIQDYVSNPKQSYGFLFKLKNEDYYRSLVFASCRNENPALYPELTVEYKVPRD